MPDLMARAAEFIAGKLAAELSRSVTYSRGGDSVAITASVGRSSFDVDDGHGMLRFETRDYIVRMDALVLGGVATLPRRGDRITEASTAPWGLGLRSSEMTLVSTRYTLASQLNNGPSPRPAALWC